MSNGEWDYDQIFTASITEEDTVWEYPPQTIAGNLSNGYDTRFLYSLGPFDLEAGTSVRVLFATFTADSIHVDPENYLNNLENTYLPDTFLSNLFFDQLIEHGHIADSLADVVSSPDYPLRAYMSRVRDPTLLH